MTETLLRLPAVKARTGLGRSSIYRKVKEGAFPAPISISERAVGWPESAVTRWIQERIDESKRGAA